MEWSHALPDVVGEGAALRLLRRRRRREWRASAARKGVVFLVGGRPAAVSLVFSCCGEGGVVLIYRLPLPLPLPPGLLGAGSSSSGPGLYGPFLPLLRPAALPPRRRVSIWAGFCYYWASSCLVGWPVCSASPSCLVTETEGGLEEERARGLARRAHGVVG